MNDPNNIYWTMRSCIYW